jgi:TfoX/Sxy family transcriptional regulator of competence genes
MNKYIIYIKKVIMYKNQENNFYVRVNFLRKNLFKKKTYTKIFFKMRKKHMFLVLYYFENKKHLIS